jgi:hypothetical protein
LAPPGHHAKRIERYTQTFNERRRMLESSLLFKIPEEFGLSVFTDMHVASSMRSLINTVSQPNTPDEIISRERNPHANTVVCKYQQVVAVRMGEKKRHAIASMHMIHVQRVPVTEIAVCLGAADHTHRATYYFYLRSTNKVVVRRYFTILHDIVPDFCQANPLYTRVLNPRNVLTDAFFPSGAVQGQPLQTSPTVVATQRILGSSDNLDEYSHDEPTSNMQPSSDVPATTHIVDSRLDEPAANLLIPPQRLQPVVETAPPVIMPVVNVPLLTSTLTTVPTPPVNVPTPPATMESLPSRTISIEAAPIVKAPPLTAPLTTNKFQNEPTERQSSIVSSTSLPINAGHQRTTKGQNRHLHFDNSYSPSQRARKSALIAQRAHERHVFSKDTWADILNPDGPC